MKLRVPFYYKNFRCISSECKDNCCLGGWEIEIDDETYDSYMHLKGELGDMVRGSVDVTDGYCFKLENGRCPFLTEKGLCRIHGELGEEYLGVVCSQFPRFSEYYGEIKESGIGLACEEAAKIIFSAKEAFYTEELPCNERYEYDEEYDRSLAGKLFKVREIIFKILNLQGHSNHEKLVIILKMCKNIQNMINSGDYDAIKEYINSFYEDDVERVLEEINSCYENGEYDHIELANSIRRIIYAYEDMEIINGEWEKMLSDCIKKFHDNMEDEEYSTINEEFLTSISERSYEYKNFLEYLVFRYFCKAIYDHDVLGKAQMLAANYLILKELDMNRWLRNKKKYTLEDRVDIIHIFSRQVEYSEDNIASLYENFLFDDVFEADNLCGLLWIDSAVL